MDLSTLRMVSKGRYGLDRSTGEDSLFTNPVLNDLVNEKHRWFASVAMCYQIPDIYTPLIVGQSAYAGNARVIEVDAKTVILQTAAATFTRLPLRQYSSLIDERGALQALANGTPSAYWMRAGSENDQSRVIELSPAPSTSTAGAGTTITEALNATETVLTVASATGINRGIVLTVDSEKMLVLAVNSLLVTVQRGHSATTAATHLDNAVVTWNLHNLIYGAWVYPSDMSADSDRPALDASEHDRLIPAICWGMAELEKSRGRTDAPVEYWQTQASEKAIELFEIIRRGTREPPRTAQVGASPIADAQERRQAKLGPLAKRLE